MYASEGVLILAHTISKYYTKHGDKGPDKIPSFQGGPFAGGWFRELGRLAEEIDAGLLRAPFRSLATYTGHFRRRVRGQTEPLDLQIIDRQSAYKISARFPGMKENDLEVRIVFDCTTIKGEKLERTEDKKKDYYLHERYFGSFQQSFDMPDDVNIDKIEARFKKGVLIITLPKQCGAVTVEKNIPIKGT